MSAQTPGVERENRISKEGLERLEKHLAAGTKMSEMILKQWVNRYGDDAMAVILKYRPEFKI